MAWIPLYQSRARHPKTLLLASLLGKDRRYVCGLLDDLWSWALDAANKDGTIPGANKKTIAVALDFSGKEGDRVVNALIESGYLDTRDDGSVCVHDWQDYVGVFSDKKEANAKRMRAARATNVQRTNGAQSAHETSTCNERAGATIQYSTIQNKSMDDADDGVRAREAKSADPFDPSPQTAEEAAARRVMLEFLPCGIPAPNAYIGDEIAGMVATPDYGATPDLRADLIIKAMKAIGEAPKEKHSWGNVKGLLAHWQKGGGREKTAKNLREQQNDDTPLTENPYTKYLAEQGVNANARG